MFDLHESGILKIAIASDLHAYQCAVGEPHESHLRVLGTSDAGCPDPFRHLGLLISSMDLKADILLSPGDLGNKASVEGIQYAWRGLHEVGLQLKAHLVTASSGNHDLDSRYQGSTVDPTETLQRLVPPYPLPDESDNNKYWARKFVVKQTEYYRLVILNSAAYHGGEPREIEYGRVSQFTIERLARELAEQQSPPVNIILCHHHPHQFPENYQSDDTVEVMKNGQLLLSSIGSGDYGNWIVIHGHKHCARLAYSQGSNSSPFVMAAGSFSAVLYPKLQTVARNQFYLLEIPLNNPLGLVGTIKAWDWTTAGWIPATRQGSGLPAESKFGCRDSAQNLARRINMALGAQSTEKWSAILQSVPEVEFLLPVDFDTLKNVLKQRYKIVVESENGIPRELGRGGSV